DYAPGSLASILASGFQINETVQFTIVRSDGQPIVAPAVQSWQIQDGVGGFAPYADANGVLHAPDLDRPADGNIQPTRSGDGQFANTALQLTATGMTSQSVATWSFTDSANQPPVLTVPGTQTVAEDTDLHITGVSVTDPDAGSNTLEVTLHTVNGLVTVTDG